MERLRQSCFILFSVVSIVSSLVIFGIGFTTIYEIASVFMIPHTHQCRKSVYLVAVYVLRCGLCQCFSCQSTTKVAQYEIAAEYLLIYPSHYLELLPYSNWIACTVVYAVQVFFILLFWHGFRDGVLFLSLALYNIYTMGVFRCATNTKDIHVGISLMFYV